MADNSFLNDNSSALMIRDPNFKDLLKTSNRSSAPRRVERFPPPIILTCPPDFVIPGAGRNGMTASHEAAKATAHRLSEIIHRAECVALQLSHADGWGDSRRAQDPVP